MYSAAPTILARPTRSDVASALRALGPWHPPALYADPRAQADFYRRFFEAEGLKAALRADYAAAVRQAWAESREAFLSRSRSFWPEYQAVNDRLIPEDPVYSGARGGVTLATNADLWTYTSPASGQARLLESYIGGESGASTVLRLALQRSTGGTTPTNQTPEKFSTRSPAAAGTFATGWSTQPTLSGNPWGWHALNTFGGFDRWVPQPGAEFYQVNGELSSARSASGTPVVSAHLVFEEL